MIHLDENYLQVRYEEEVPCVVMEWKEFATSEEFRTGLNKGLSLLTDKGTENWLADLRKMDVIDPEDEKWSNEDWFPRALAGGVKKMALIPSEDVFNSLSVENIMSEVANTDLVIHYFEDPDEAKSWLASN
ncbi:STAS/SEC14 domain-containing protein [Tunicatimonas pelagia]|uniref:STAS/SEC14 domain-containing protein n=1 Tax=Tunicatimonas pelagia TaxID=931531 RepID=UPI00266700D6|nr:STAS/SEC14 domain-containing protein [Tunicatimonas pelagia]WKN44069.1 STAS/SEC14 domain-containing protein [Tunicatimonas pelagia]